MSSPPSSTWELSSLGADANAHVALPSQTSSDDAARMIAAAVGNLQSDVDGIQGSPMPAQLEEPVRDDDIASELRATFPNGPPESVEREPAAP